MILSCIVGIATLAAVGVGYMHFWRERDLFMCVLVTIGGALGALFSSYIWKYAKPTIALAKAEWACVDSHTQSTSSTTIINGRPMATVSGRRVCDAYRRKGR